MNFLLDWLDQRTGIRQLTREALYERVPGGSQWRYVSGSMLVFAFATQAVTGLILWMSYSPGSQNAWESVYYIQNVLHGGWLLRGVHHFMAHAMVVLLPMHLWQVVWDRAYAAPREVNYWLGLVLMLIVLGLSLTGYLLPWDQKGYWATKVATNLMSLAPGGPYLQKLVVGGSNYGHLTLTRFFAVHAGLLPALLVVFLSAHIYVFRRHGITTHPDGRRPDQFFWPQQVLKDAVACLLLMLLVLLLVVHFNPLAPLQGGDLGELGAELSAPADPVEAFKAARPEWYFLFLFQLLKKVPDEFIGAIVLPGVIVAYLFIMPWLGRFKVGHVLNVVVLLGLFGGVAYLTGEALYFDNYARSAFQPENYTAGPQRDQYVDRYNESREYLAAVEQGHREYQRVKELAAFYGIPRQGAIYLQRNDSETMGPRLLRGIVPAVTAIRMPRAMESLVRRPPTGPTELPICTGLVHATGCGAFSVLREFCLINISAARRMPPKMLTAPTAPAAWWNMFWTISKTSTQKKQQFELAIAAVSAESGLRRRWKKINKLATAENWPAVCKH